MGKTVAGIVVLIVVVVGGFLLLSRDSAAPSPLDTVPAGENTDTAGPADAAPVIVMTAPADGTYQIAASSTVNAEGKKSLIADYVDTATVALKSGSATIAGGNITSGSFVFDMTTISVGSTGKNAGEAMLEKHLKSKDFFSVEEFGTAEFKVKEATPATDVATSFTHTLKGDFTVKGVTKELSFPVKVFTAADGSTHVVADFLLDRTNWDIRYGSNKFFDNLANNVIDDNFRVYFDLVATRV